MRKTEEIAAIKTGIRNATSCSPKILIDVLDRMEKRVCWLGPAYWNRSWEGVEAMCSRYVFASSPLSGTLSPRRQSKAKKNANVTGVFKEYFSLSNVINLTVFTFYECDS